MSRQGVIGTNDEDEFSVANPDFRTAITATADATKALATAE